MRRVLHLFLIFAVMWCGSHLGEPAEHREPALSQVLTLDAHLLPGDDQSSDAPGDHSGGGHHHCPIAPDTSLKANCSEPLAADPLLFARRANALTSFPQAPPVQPPSA